MRHPRALSTVIRANDLPLPSERISAGFDVSTHADPGRRWKLAVRELSTDKSGMLGHVMILKSMMSFACDLRTDHLCRSLREVSELSVEIRVSFELSRMLGNG